MTTYSREERLAEIQKAGFANPLTALAVSLAEFGDQRDINAQGQSDVKNPNGPNGREDSWGPWQIYLPAHPNVTRSCALDLSCSTAKAAEISKGGTDFGAWSAFTNGSYQRFIAEIQSLLPSPSSGGGPDPGTSSSSGPSPAAPPLDPDLLKRIRESLGAIIVGITHGGGSVAGRGEEIVAQLQKLYPDVPASTLRDIVSGKAAAGAQNINNAPGIGGGVAIADKLQSATSSLDFVKALFAPDNLWRLGFAALGGVLIFAGARLYFHQDVGSEQPVGA